MSRKKRGFCIFPGYNWCGPGCSGPGAPINRVDVACKKHDESYRLYRNPCECDQQLLYRLNPLINSNTEEGRHARLLYNYIKLQTLFTCSFYNRK